MQASKLIRPKSILKPQSFSKLRLGFCNFYCSKTTDEEETVKKITTILNTDDNWGLSIKNLNYKLNPDLVESILHQNLSCDPQTLLHFFYWSSAQMGISQNLISYLILSMYLCNSNKLRKSSDVLDRMIETCMPFSDVVDILSTSVSLSSLGFTQIIYAYKNKEMLNEAVALLLLSSKNADCFPNLKCVNSLMIDLLKNDKMDLFWKVYDRLVEANVTPDEYTYSNVINAYCKIGKIEDAKRVFAEMEAKNCSPTLRTYIMLIGGLCRHGLVNEAFSYKISLTEKGLIEEAVGVKDEMVAKKCEPRATLRCVNILMKDLLKLNEMKLFWNMNEKMLADKLEPDDFTYTNLIEGNMRVGNLDQAKKLLFEMENPSLLTYNLLIKGLCKKGLVDEAFEFKSLMKKKGLRPDIYTYTNLIDGLCKLKRSHDAKLLLEDMHTVGLTPNHFTYTALINGFLKQGEVNEAFKLQDKMVSDRIEGNSVTFNCLINGLCKLGQFEKAIKILEGMKDQGVLPDVICYNSLIDGLCNAKRTDEASGFLAQMVENGVKPNTSTYGPLISAYNSLAEVKVANEYFREMTAHGIIPSHAILASMIDGHCREGNSTEALSIFRDMVDRSITPDLKIYKTFILGFTKNETMESAMEVFTEAGEKGLNLDVFCYTCLISGFIKQGDLKKAFQLFDGMQQRNVRPNIFTYNTLINGLCKTGDVKRARELFDEIPGKADVVTYATLIGGYCISRNLFEAFKLLVEMIKKGIQADEIVYKTLVNGCCKEGDTERGLLVFDRMVTDGFASTPTFNTLINWFCRKGKFSEPFASIDEAKNKLGFDTCKYLIVGLKDGGYDENDLAKIFEDMVKFGWVSGSMTLNELINQEETQDIMSNEAANG